MPALSRGFYFVVIYLLIILYFGLCFVLNIFHTERTATGDSTRFNIYLRFIFSGLRSKLRIFFQRHSCCFKVCLFCDDTLLDICLFVKRHIYDSHIPDLGRIQKGTIKYILIVSLIHYQLILNLFQSEPNAKFIHLYK